jgi:hypothetical protein
VFGHLFEDDLPAAAAAVAVVVVEEIIGCSHRQLLLVGCQRGFAQMQRASCSSCSGSSIGREACVG